jgi:hypothetical protein
MPTLHRHYRRYDGNEFGEKLGCRSKNILAKNQLLTTSYQFYRVDFADLARRAYLHRNATAPLRMFSSAGCSILASAMVCCRTGDTYPVFSILRKREKGTRSAIMSNTIDSDNPSGNKSSLDPLDFFVSNHRRFTNKKRGPRFNAGEHAWLASRGAVHALECLKTNNGINIPASIFAAIERNDGEESLQYGELVALSGDFYETPDALFDEKSALIPWLYESNDLSDLRKIFAKELQWIEARRQGTAGASYPDENIALAWNAKSYVELALRNTDHFGWHNIVAYCKYHAEALRLADSARGIENSPAFRRALYTNAFADHFLTDGFAAGHIRVPRAEIRTWASENQLSEKVAGALSKLLHDQDGHVDIHSLHSDASEHREGNDKNGLRVKDATGACWYTYCDGQLFLETQQGQHAVERAVLAVSASVCELLLAWKRAELPAGVYEATKFVPFPHPETPALTTKFPADMPEADIDRLWDNVSWYAKVPWISGLERSHIKALFRALPQIMENFRTNIAAAADDAELRRRIDPRYIEAYKNIR